MDDYPPLNKKQGTYTAQFEHVSQIDFHEKNILMVDIRPFCFDQPSKRSSVVATTTSCVGEWLFIL